MRGLGDAPLGRPLEGQVDAQAGLAYPRRGFERGPQHGTLTRCIAAYKSLGCWTPHVEITQPALEAAMDVFEYAGSLKQRYRWDQICAPSPG